MWTDELRKNEIVESVAENNWKDCYLFTMVLSNLLKKLNEVLRGCLLVNWKNGGSTIKTVSHFVEMSSQNERH